eukprot:TRINITY_DN49168_c0_g1_i1.p1 TRINITY_DN49168_c0_g1~~TRINITY_DN49168_c0_g1_i1.p1  ORF type:complete len:358 (-),score=70.58 TRINITY_DN49168_c0_g1_i1:60-1052(-)
MRPGDIAEVQLPSTDHKDVIKTWSVRLLHRSGSQEAVAFIWLGDEKQGDNTIYVAFSPLRKKRQFFRIWSSKLEPHSVSGNGGAGTASIEVLSYVSRKLAKLWGQCGLLKNLLEVTHAHPEKKLIFAGISHGAVLAQAAAFQFRVSSSLKQTTAVTWNAYRWTDEAGSKLVGEVLGSDLLALVLSRQNRPSCSIPCKSASSDDRHWDSVAGFPSSLAPMPRVVQIDADTGEFFPCEKSFYEKQSGIGADFVLRALELHFASSAIRATKLAMKAVTTPEASFVGSPAKSDEAGTDSESTDTDSDEQQRHKKLSRKPTKGELLEEWFQSAGH